MTLIKSIMDDIKDYTVEYLNDELEEAGLETFDHIRIGGIVSASDTKRRIGISWIPDDEALKGDGSNLNIDILVDCMLLSADDIDNSTVDSKLYDYTQVLFSFYDEKDFGNGSYVMSMGAFHAVFDNPAEVTVGIRVMIANQNC